MGALHFFELFIIAFSYKVVKNQHFQRTILGGRERGVTKKEYSVYAFDKFWTTLRVYCLGGDFFYLFQHGGESTAGHCLLVRWRPGEVSPREVAARVTERQREALVIMDDHHLRRRVLVSTAVARPVVARRPLRAAVGRL